MTGYTCLRLLKFTCKCSPEKVHQYVLLTRNIWKYCFHKDCPPVVSALKVPHSRKPSTVHEKAWFSAWVWKIGGKYKTRYSGENLGAKGNTLLSVKWIWWIDYPPCMVTDCWCCLPWFSVPITDHPLLHHWVWYYLGVQLKGLIIFNSLSSPLPVV